MTEEFKAQAEEYKKLLIEKLALIEWKLKPVGCGNYRFVNHKGIAQPIKFYYDRIEFEPTAQEYDFAIGFNMSQIEIQEIRLGDADLIECISFHGKVNQGCYLNINNFDRKAEVKGDVSTKD